MSGGAQQRRPRAGAARLGQALRRAGHALRARQRTTGPAADSGSLPHSSWEQQAELRLRAIEQQLSNQNRLLLITIITIVGETIYKVTIK